MSRDIQAEILAALEENMSQGGVNSGALSIQHVPPLTIDEQANHHARILRTLRELEVKGKAVFKNGFWYAV